MNGPRPQLRRMRRHSPGGKGVGLGVRSREGGDQEGDELTYYCSLRLPYVMSPNPSKGLFQFFDYMVIWLFLHRVSLKMIRVKVDKPSELHLRQTAALISCGTHFPTCA